LEFIEHGWTERLGQHLEMGRQALHAAQLDFKAPNFTRVFRAPLAADMRDFILQKMHCSPEALQQVCKL
jgi:hypothetical protein